MSVGSLLELLASGLITGGVYALVFAFHEPMPSTPSAAGPITLRYSWNAVPTLA